MPVCAILYDESHIWGILVFRAFKAMGIPYEPINSKKITQGALFRNPAYRCLVVPGGSARLKSLALGKEGQAAIRRWLREGGGYLGFCGGAGLALSGAEGSLGLCPWRRGTLDGQNSHCLAGAINAKLQNGKTVSLPVWWPGRFAPDEASLEILASYHFPPGQPDSKDFPAGQPLIISGRAGAGRYVLSYAHLETPAWPEANSLLADLLQSRFNLVPKTASVPPWNVFREPASPLSSLNMEMAEAWRKILALVRKGEDLGLLLPRESWLSGWKPGIPGMAIAALLGLTHFLAENAPPSKANAAWPQSEYPFMKKLEEFCGQAAIWLESYPGEQNNPEFPGQQKYRIFGHPMRGGGMAGELLAMLEKIDLLDCGAR